MKTPIFLTIAAIGLLGLNAILAVTHLEHLRREQRARHPGQQVPGWSQRLAWRREEWVADVRTAAAMVRLALAPPPTPAEARSFAAYFAKTNLVAAGTFSPLESDTARSNPVVSFDGAAQIQATHHDVLSRPQPLPVSVAAIQSRMISSQLGSGSTSGAPSAAIADEAGELRGNIFPPALHFEGWPVFHAVEPLNAVSKFVFRNLRLPIARR